MLDPFLLKTFLVIAEGHSFSETSRKLAMRQSTVSDHVRRLEQHLGRQLFVRDTHSVVLTAEGEALIGYARLILETAERAEQFFAGTRAQGRLRFGAYRGPGADLPPRRPGGVYPQSPGDRPRTDRGAVLDADAVASTAAGSTSSSCKRWTGEERGELVWRDRIAWVGRPDLWRGRHGARRQPAADLLPAAEPHPHGGARHLVAHGHRLAARLHQRYALRPRCRHAGRARHHGARAIAGAGEPRPAALRRSARSGHARFHPAAPHPRLARSRCPNSLPRS